MKRVLGWTGLGLAALGVGVVSPTGLAAALAVAGGIAAIWWVGRCRHSGPLGLLPPTTGQDGVKVPARWYCDHCGRSWPAGIERDHRPVVRFSGYDQSKLPAAARRAETLARQRQALAVRRAGLSARRPAAAAPAKVTSISDRRAG